MQTTENRSILQGVVRSTAKYLCFLALATGVHLPANDADLVRELRRRREAVMERMGGRGMLVLFSAQPRPYSGDVHYEFRQESNLYYLCGIKQPEVALVLMPQNARYREILFLPERDAAREIWTGKMLSPQEAGEISGIEHIWSASEFEPFMDAVLNGRPFRVDRYVESDEYRAFFADLKEGEAVVFLLLQQRPGLKGRFSPEFDFAGRLRERFLGLEAKDCSEMLAELRLVKSAYEIRQLRRAIAITTEAHRHALKTIRPGIWEYEIEAEIEYVFKRSNSSDWAFPSIIGSGPNATVLHYDKNQRQAQEGELVLIDIGAEYNYYAADVTRTVPVSGKFSPQQAEIYQIVLDAQKAGLEEVKPGSKLSLVHERALAVIKERLFGLGLIQDTSGDEYRKLFPHFTAHWLGLDVHDAGSRFAELRPGMVLTVEPGIYVRQQGPEKYHHIGVRIEDDVLVTEDGYELLSADAPREISEIEALMCQPCLKSRAKAIIRTHAHGNVEDTGP